MPLVHVSLRRGKPAAYRQAILDGIYRALRATFDVPEEDRFMTITEHDEADFSYSRTYLGIDRTDDLVMIQLTVSNTRTVEQKKALYKRIVERLEAGPGVKPNDVLISIIEVVKENWSMGNGRATFV